VDPSKFQAAIQLLKESEEKLRKENPVKIAWHLKKAKRNSIL
jgi:hypothetical protein